MQRVTRSLLLASSAWLLGACADGAVTSPQTGAATRPASDVSAQAAPLPTSSCTYSANGEGTYDVTVTWSNLSVTWIEITAVSGLPELQEALKHPTRRDSLSWTVQGEPYTVTLAGRDAIGVRTLCQGG